MHDVSKIERALDRAQDAFLVVLDKFGADDARTHEALDECQMLESELAASQS